MSQQPIMTCIHEQVQKEQFHLPWKLSWNSKEKVITLSLEGHVSYPTLDEEPVQLQISWSLAWIGADTHIDQGSYLHVFVDQGQGFYRGDLVAAVKYLKHLLVTYRSQVYQSLISDQDPVTWKEADFQGVVDRLKQSHRYSDQRLVFE